MFQLALSDRLRSHLKEVVSSPHEPSRQPIVRPASQSLMNRVPDYERLSHADNASIFHGRELRGIPNANGGMGFVLQLSYADPSSTKTLTTSTLTSAVDGVVVPSGKGADSAWDGRAVDDQGWLNEEIATYSRWRYDRVQQWRNAKTYVAEEFDRFSEVFRNLTKAKNGSTKFKRF